MKLIQAQFKTKFTPEEIALVVLDKYKHEIENYQDVHQVTFNIITDKLRKYLGESSKIYVSFAAIDISIQDGNKSERIQNGVKLIQAAINTVESEGIYEDLQMQMLRLNIKSMKNKTKYALWGAIGGVLLTNVKDIVKYLLLLLHLPQP